MKHRLAVFLIVVLSFFSIFPTIWASKPPPEADGLLVKFKGDTLVKAVPLPPGENVSNALKRWRRYRDLIEYVEPNVLFHAAFMPNDPLYPDQWALPAIDAPSAWNVTTGAENTTIAILDSGVDINHPDLAANIAVNTKEIAGNGVDDDGNGFVDDVNGWDFVNNVADPSPKFNGSETTAGTHHGTIVAGIAAAVGNNGIGVVGVAWSAKILPVRVLDGQGIGNTLVVAEGIAYAVKRGARVVNLSFVGSASNETLDNAIAAARAAGVTVVAAAGNEGLNLDVNPQYPVCTDGVIGVAALTANNVRASFSNYGRTCIDIAAPGENITSTSYDDPARGYTDVYQDGWFGTSVAAPFVTGVIALVVSTHPDWTRSQVESSVLEHARKIDGGSAIVASLGAGALNASAALSAAGIASSSYDLLTFPGAGGGPQVKRYQNDGKVRGQFFALPKTTRTGGSIAGIRLENGVQGVVVGSADENSTAVRITDFSGNTQLSFLAYPKSVRGGVNVATGDLDADGVDEIVVGLRRGSSQVRIFDVSGHLLGQFFAYSKNFRGGINLAVADLKGDNRAEIIVGTVAGAPQVRIFNGKGKLQKQFYAFDESERNGIVVGAGDLAASGVPQIVVARATGEPLIRTFTQIGEKDKQFFAFAKSFSGGVTLAVADLNGDNRAEIIVGTVAGAPQVRIFSGSGAIQRQFFAYDKSFRGGVRVGSIRN